MRVEAGYRRLLLTGALAGAGSLTPAYATVTLSTGATTSIACTSGTCVPTAVEAVLNVGQLQAMLAVGDVTVFTTGQGVEAADIAVTTPLQLTASTKLRLQASHSIIVAAPVVIGHRAELSLIYDKANTDNGLMFSNDGRVRSPNAAGTLRINDEKYTLVDSVAALARAVHANPSVNVALADNYDAAADGTYRGAPVGVELLSKAEGLGNVITNLSIGNAADEGADVGLFADANTASAIENFRLTRLTITVSRDYSGAIGGLVGRSLGALTGNEIGGDVSTGYNTAGGLVGMTTGRLVRNAANVHVQGLVVGGLVGSCQSCKILLSSATGGARGSGYPFVRAMKASKRRVGGLVGFGDRYSRIDQSFSSGAVRAGRGTNIGGLTGLYYGAVNDSYSTVGLKYSQTASAGGALGSGGVQLVQNSYALGRTIHGFSQAHGGFRGNTIGRFNDCYWDVTVSQTKYGGAFNSNGLGVTGLTTAQFLASLPAGFSPAIWGQNSAVNGGYPYLLNNPPR